MMPSQPMCRSNNRPTAPFATRWTSIPAPLRIALTSAFTILMFCCLSLPLAAQGSMSLPTSVNTASTSTSTDSFIAFDITAQQAVRLYRFSNTFASTTTTLVDVWARPNGYTNQNNGWIHIGRASVTPTSTTTPTQIPVNLDFLINAQETWGFIISHHSNSVKYSSTVTPATQSDQYITISAGAHCAGTGVGDPITGVTSFNFSLCPRQIVGIVHYDEGATAPNDAGIASIDSPLNFCAGVNDVKVTLQNFGINQITSATINWKLNGVTQTPYSWTGVLDTLNAASRKTSVTLATQNFLPNTPYVIEAWTSLPNGVVDTVTNNDSCVVSRKAAMSGTFTVGGTSPDFPTIAAAASEVTANGVCGPVVFNVRPGTYNEQVAVGVIGGASAVNTITFQSETGDSSSVVVTSSAATSTSNYVLQLSGAKYVTFKDMTFRTTNTTYAAVVDIRGGSEYNTLDNLELIGITTTSTTQQYAVIASPSGTLDPNNTIKNCSILNGSVGIYMYGSGTTSTEDNVTIQGNYIAGFYYTPVYLYYLGKLKYLDNVSEHTSAYTSKYNGMFHYGYDTQIERNSFYVTGGTYSYGVYLYYDNYYQAGSSRFVNNFITSEGGTSTTYGVRPYYCYDLLFAHNTVQINSTYATSYAVYNQSGTNLRFLNNIMGNLGAGRAWYVSAPAAITESDYNDIHVAGPVLAYWSGDRATLQDLRQASGMDMASVSKAPAFLNLSNGDLHLTTPSDDDDDLIGTMLPEVTDDIDNDIRVRPYMGADEACYLIPNSLTYEFVDGAGAPVGYAEIPGTLGVHYTVIFPAFDANVQMTVNLYSVNNNQLQYSTTISDYKPANQTLDGTQYFTLPSNIPPGFYRIEVVFNTKNSCGYYRNYMPYPSSLMLIDQGNIPCEVWPGDVNNDGLVNYTDRKDLNVYIHDANLRTMWLNGPARYRADAAQDPLTYLRWQPQAGVPWQTPEGCYMDADGNGVINNFDYIAIKLNWMRTHGAITPKSDRFTPSTFDMSQNYPNPFNPTTTLQYSLPERSQVQLRIIDMLGRPVATPVDGMVEAGVHTLHFDGTNLSSGQYLAIISMTGVESGLGFTKTVKMTLNK